MSKWTLPKPRGRMLVCTRCGDDRDVMEAAQGAVSELSALVKEQVDERPYTVLGAAFGVGLVLGGGLPLAIVGLGARAAAGVAMRQMVEGMLLGAALAREVY